MEKSFWQNQHVQILFKLTLLAAVVALAAYANYTWQLAKGVYTGAATVTVSGEGTVTAVPDIGTFNFTVEVEAKDVAAAQTEGTEKMDEIVSYLEGEGVAETDIKTSNYNAYPRYELKREGACTPELCVRERVLVAYVVSQTVTVKVRDIDEAGALITGVGERGATNLSGLSFTIDDESALKQEARAKAIAEAKAKAEVLAEDLGMDINRLVGFYEVGGDQPIYYGMGGEKAMTDSYIEEAAPAVLPVGENEIKSVVNITYELK